MDTRTTTPIVILDPGHGGDHPNGKSMPMGAESPSGLVEKHVTYQVARHAADALQGVTAQLTRGPDDNPSLADRIAVSRQREAAVFVSIHADGGANGTGAFRAWVHDQANAASQRLAVGVLQELAVVGQATDVPARGSLAVLTPSSHGDQTAACLVDLGDLSSATARLGDPAHQAALGRAIAGAIATYLRNETAVPPAVASQLAHTGRPVSSALTLVSITHAGSYRLAYDRHTRVGELGGDRDSRTFQGTQALQDALNTWATHIPTVMQPPRYVLTGGLYVNKSGEHGRGNAVDVDGFWWSDSNKFLAVNAPSDWFTYLTIEASLRKAFGTVLNYDYNAAHHDHWHCDLGYPTTWRHAHSQTLFVKRALNEIWGESLTVDRNWDSAAAAAARRAGYDLATSGAWTHFLDDMIARQSTQASSFIPRVA